jgi:hypothetical protein
MLPKCSPAGDPHLRSMKTLRAGSVSRPVSSTPGPSLPLATTPARCPTLRNRVGNSLHDLEFVAAAPNHGSSRKPQCFV